MKILNLKQFVKEGAGAGYTVEINGIKLDWKTIQIIDNSIKMDTDEYGTLFKVNIIKNSEVESWKADGYYDGISSEYASYDMPLSVKGGTAYFLVSNNEFEQTVEDIKEELLNTFNGTDIDISTMYGAGWSHVYLGNNESFGMDIDTVVDTKELKKYRRWTNEIIGDIENEHLNYTCYVIHIDINMPEISKMINKFFKDPEDFYEEFDDEDDSEFEEY